MDVMRAKEILTAGMGRLRPEKRREFVHEVMTSGSEEERNLLSQVLEENEEIMQINYKPDVVVSMANIVGASVATITTLVSPFYALLTASVATAAHDVRQAISVEKSHGRTIEAAVQRSAQYTNKRADTLNEQILLLTQSVASLAQQIRNLDK